jgi:hypothetical protein
VIRWEILDVSQIVEEPRALYRHETGVILLDAFEAPATRSDHVSAPGRLA